LVYCSPSQVTYYLHFHPTKAIKVFRKASIEPVEDDRNSSPELKSVVSAVSVEEKKSTNGNVPSSSSLGEGGSSSVAKKPSKSSYIKRQISEVWTTHGKLLLHPRPSAPITKH